MVQVTDRRRLNAQNRVENDTVFILGPARSGTTLLYKGLCLHPEVAFISNWSARFPGVPMVASLNRAARRLPSRARQAWFSGGSDAYVYGASRRLIDRVFPTPVEGEPVYTRAGVQRPGGPGPARVDPRSALPAAFDSIRTLGAGSCLVSKRIANNLRIPLLHRVFPERAVRSTGARWTGGRRFAVPRRLVGRQLRLVVRRHAAGLAGRREGPVGDVRQELGRGARSDRRRPPRGPGDARDPDPVRGSRRGAVERLPARGRVHRVCPTTPAGGRRSPRSRSPTRTTGGGHGSSRRWSSASRRIQRTGLESHGYGF